MIVIFLAMVISIHQPHFFPWLGYFDKIINSNIFVILDNVQFEKNYFQNRTKLKNLNEQTHWFGVPVQKAPLSTKINEINIASVFNPISLINCLKQFYRKALFFNLYFDDISDILLSDNKTLFEINYKTLTYILNLLEVKTKIIIASDLNIQEQDPSLRLIKICQHFKADTYLSGVGGRSYMDLKMFEQEKIKVIWQDFNPENYKYKQLGSDFIPGLSVLDVLFNVGTEELKNLLVSNLK